MTKRKKLGGFSYFKNMANFEVFPFRKSIKLSINLLFQKSSLQEALLTNIKARPIKIRPIREANHRPILCPIGPKRLVPIRYEMEAGKKAAPNSHFSASILSIMNIGREGSSIAMPMLAKVIAPKKIISSKIWQKMKKIKALFLPAATSMYGSDTKAFKLGASSSLLVTQGCNTNNCKPIF